MFVQKYEVNITTDADGDGVGYTPVCNGRVLAVSYIKPSSGGFADGVDFNITTEDSLQEVWDQDDVNASAIVVPRQATHSTAGVAALYAAGGTAVNDYVFVADERIKITVASGGDGGVGKFIVMVG